MKEISSTLSRTFRFDEKEFMDKLGLDGKFQSIRRNNEDKSIEIITVERVAISKPDTDEPQNP